MLINNNISYLFLKIQFKLSTIKIIKKILAKISKKVQSIYGYLIINKMLLCFGNFLNFYR